MTQKQSRSNSSLIHAFTLARQQMELEEDKKNLAQLVELTSQRRDERNKKFDQPKKGEKKKSSEALKGAERYRMMDEHKIPVEELLMRLEVKPEEGLSSQVAIQRNSQYGDNVLSEKKARAWYIKLMIEMCAPLSVLLWIGGVLCFIAYGLAPEDPSNAYLGAALFFVIIFVGIQNFVQHGKSEAIMASFKNFIPPKAKVLRDGAFSNVEAQKLVPGDIVEVRAGDKIPADIRIILSQEMKVDNSSLTGESDPLLRTVECTNKENALETANLAFFGTLCKEGLARGVVVNIGDSTIIGQIANLATSAQSEETPLKKEIHRFVMIIACFAFGTGFFFMMMGFVIGYNAVTCFGFGVGVLAAYVPEGLATCIVVALTMAAKKLASKKVLVKNLEAVEALGSTSCICSDKTGTLTQNRMTVKHLWYDGKIFNGDNYQKCGGENGKFEYDINSRGFKTFQQTAVACSDAVFDNAVPASRLEKLNKITNDAEKEKTRKKIEEDYLKELNNTLWLDRPVVGDASETGLVKFFQAIEDVKVIRDKYQPEKMSDGSLTKIPFNSSWKYALVITEDETKDSVHCIYIKGAPEKIWSLCSHISIDGQSVPIDSEWQKKFDQANFVFGNGGERVLGFAKLHLPKDKYPASYQFDCKNPAKVNYPMKGFTFTGLISLVDPPREAVPYAILKCRTAGIKVIMVTGDQPVTAAAIARQVNIFQKDEKTVNQIMEEEKVSFDEAFDRSEALVIHGDMITKATKDDELLPLNERGKTILRWLEKPRLVFARTTPAQKLIIVSACQAQGHIVAVTGDGVNDSPAIKKADIGIAMGIAGSDVAKDAADMILLSDDFSAIVIGVEEGRKIFDNLKRSCIYVLTADMSELVPFLSLIVLGFPLPLSTILVLLVDLGFNIIPSISWATEDAEMDVMVRQPRKPTDHLITKRILTSAYAFHGVYVALAGFLTYFVIMNDFGFGVNQLFGLAMKQGFRPSPSDVYDPTTAFYGHTSPQFIEYCQNCWDGTGSCDISELEDDQISGVPDWIFAKDSELELRLYYLRCTDDGQVVSEIDWEPCNVKQISPISDMPFCYTTESLKMAQTGFYLSMAFAEMCLLFAIKSRKISFTHTGLNNHLLIFSFFWICAFTLFISYLSPLNVGLNTRPPSFLHYGLPGLPFCIFIVAFDEARKFLMRLMPAHGKKPNWLQRNSMW